jgi:hypothetical protein
MLRADAPAVFAEGLMGKNASCNQRRETSMKRRLTLIDAAPSPPAEPASAKVAAQEAALFVEALKPAGAGVRWLPLLESA